VKGSTAIPRPTLLAKQLRSLQPVRRLPGRNDTKADILQYRCDGANIAVKDYGPRSLLIRNTIGRFLIRRESRAYRATTGLPGIPRFFGRLGPFAFATEWVEGRPLAELMNEKVPQRCFDRLREILGLLHEHGIALGDLHMRDVLIGAEREVHVIDFATALLLGESPGRTRRGLFERLCDQDRIALARMEARFSGRDPDEAVSAAGERAATWYRRGRRLKGILDRIRGRRERI
jgi:hypothetical protein